MDASLTYLHHRLALLEARVRAAVAQRRVDDPVPDDRFRGLYLSDAQVDAILEESGRLLRPAIPEPETSEAQERIEKEADAAESAGEVVRLRELARRFDLAELDVDILLVAIAPDLDPRFEPLYGYLHDDVTRRRASTGLALELIGRGTGAGEARGRFNADGRLVGSGLLVVEETERPFLTRSLRVPDRVTSHLLGDDTPDPAVAALMTDCTPADIGDRGMLERVLTEPRALVYLKERPGAASFSFASSALEAVGRPWIALDLHRLDPTDDPCEIAAAAAREARLIGGAVVAGPVDDIAEREGKGVRCFAELRCPTVLVGTKGWDPMWSRDVPLLLDAPRPTVEQRERIWRSALDGHLPGDEVVRATAAFHLTPEQAQRAAVAAEQYASASCRPVEVPDVQAGARAQNAAGLERLARRIRPRALWEDLILKPKVEEQLRELVARVKHRATVLETWQMGVRSTRGRGITGLFAGESGTGKTMSAEVIAGALGLDLYVIDLSTVVSKYIGETEKNLDRIFGEADRVSGVLLFDEADALFGKRSEVKDAHDRYANVETAYLLQRMEQFDGLAILTTNLRSNIDEAFTRRLDVIVDIPIPEEPDRRRLWELYVSKGIPLGDDLDLDFLAGSFEVAGGNIRNIVVTSAYLAAADSTPVTMGHLIRGTEREYRKLGRLCLEDDFGPYFHLVANATPVLPGLS
ncbi:MAG: ATP-binding protein [Actinobacteria bacterium]|nr:ATP-binding protein [Actinomycetota bacterium]